MTDILRAWVGRSFRNRIFVAMLAATLLPLLVCGGLMLNLQVTRSQESLAQESHAQLAALGGALDDFRDACRDIARTLSDSTVVRSALRRGGEDSRTLYQVLFRTAESLRPYARFDIYDRQGVCHYRQHPALRGAGPGLGHPVGRRSGGGSGPPGRRGRRARRRPGGAQPRRRYFGICDRPGGAGGL